MRDDNDLGVYFKPLPMTPCLDGYDNTQEVHHIFAADEEIDHCCNYCPGRSNCIKTSSESGKIR
jgi:hypothetical protein